MENEFRSELINLLTKSIEEDDGDELFFEEASEKDEEEEEDLPIVQTTDDGAHAPVEIDISNEETRSIPDEPPWIDIDQDSRERAGRGGSASWRGDKTSGREDRASGRDDRASERGDRALERGRGEGLQIESSNIWKPGQPLIEKIEKKIEKEEETFPEIRQVLAKLHSDMAKENRAKRGQKRSEALLHKMNDQDELDESKQFFDTTEFVWNPVNEWESVKEEFVPTSTGPTEPVADSYDAFRKYWDDEILAYIVVETNRNAQLIGEKCPRFRALWCDTNVDELLALFCFWLMLEVITMPTINSCFSIRPIMQVDIFRHLFPKARYFLLTQAFSLASSTGDANKRNNLLLSMGPIPAYLSAKFQQLYTLQQDICAKKLLKLNRYKLIFSYQLCESATGYFWSFVMCDSNETSASAVPKSLKYVRKLVQPLLNRGHTLFLDDMFNSPALARFLKRNKTDCVGTLDTGRKGVPPVIKEPLQRGEFVARQSGDVMVVSVQDRRRMTFISTCHGLAQIQMPSLQGPPYYRLQLEDDYERGTRGVAKLDQALETYSEKRRMRLVKTFFMRLLYMSIINAGILLERTGNHKVNPLAFRVDLVEKIIAHHVHYVSKPSRFSERLTGRHFIRRTPLTESVKAKVKKPPKRVKRQCVWCSANNLESMTDYECPNCDVPLCLHVCFEAYHTEPDIPDRSSL